MPQTRFPRVSACLILAMVIAGWAARPVYGDEAQAMDQHLVQIEQLISQRLVPLSEHRSARPAIETMLARQGADLLNHLRSLEAVASVLPEDASVLRRRLDQLESRVEGLGGLEPLASPVAGESKALTPLGGITGRVIHTATGEGLAFVDIQVYNESGFLVAFNSTDSSGSYSVNGLENGTYFAHTVNFVNYIDELYDDGPCNSLDGCEPTNGTPILVALDGVTSGIDFGLDLGGRVEGTLTIVGGSAPFVSAQVIGPDGRVSGFVPPDDDGHYKIEGLPTASYLVAASGFGVTTVLYDGVECLGDVYTCPLDEGTPVAVAVETAVSGIDFALDRLGAITGTVTTLGTGLPIPNTLVNLWAPEGFSQDFAQTDETGFYQIDPISPGTYFVTVEDFGHLGQLYDGLRCDNPPDDCDPTGGTPVIVTVNTTTTIDVAMPRRPMGSISGTVVSEAVVGEDTGDPIPFIDLTVWDSDGNQISFPFGSTDLEGHYEVAGLDPGTYFVTAHSRSGDFIDELYEDLPCPFPGCDPTTGTPVVVLDETATTNIDFVLDRLGVISGSIRDAVIGRRIDGSARVWNTEGNFAGSAPTDGDGNYRIEGLSPGTYFVDTIDSEGYASELYDDLPCPPSSCDRTAGAPLAVALNAPVTGIDFELDIPQGIRGRVTREDTGQPLASIDINLWDTSGRDVGRATTDANGEYRTGLTPGTYFVTATSFRPFMFDGIDELYDDLPCDDLNCDPTLGTPVIISEGSVTQGINFALAPATTNCVPDLFSHCLADNRFSVRATWTDFVGETGAARADSKLTDATGTFWFFGPENVELVVKVLDACVEPFNRFWVFAGGLTNVGVELNIFDTQTGQTRIYSSRLGEAFAPIQDTDAFDTCPVARSGESEAEALVGATRRELAARVARLRAGERLQTTLTSPALVSVEAKQGACTPTATSLCLEQGRFRVESTWRTAAGETGDGQAVPLSDATGTFWFFSPDNVEALVKVLNACDLAGFENFWVFAAGLTDVEVTIRVTDTVSGEVKDYTNPQSTPFLPVQDTGAFQTCEGMGG